MFARKYRIVRASDFAKIASSRQCFFAPYFTLKLRENNLPYSRYAVVVSNKISKKATVRNKLKRKLRENLKQLHPQMKPGHDIVIYAKFKAQDADKAVIQEFIKKGLQQLQVITLEHV